MSQQKLRMKAIVLSNYNILHEKGCRNKAEKEKEALDVGE